MHTDSRSAQPDGAARSSSTRLGEKPLVIEPRVSLVMERRKPVSCGGGEGDGPERSKVITARP